MNRSLLFAFMVVSVMLVGMILVGNLQQDGGSYSSSISRPTLDSGREITGTVPASGNGEGQGHGQGDHPTHTPDPNITPTPFPTIED